MHPIIRLNFIQHISEACLLTGASDAACYVSDGKHFSWASESREAAEERIRRHNEVVDALRALEPVIVRETPCTDQHDLGCAVCA
jgi:hypothetical protein